MKNPKIGLALSGGGSRAIAFHLGCLKALHDRGILNKISMLSGVSGGSVIAALYAYSDDPFETFVSRVETVLSKGMIWGMIRETFFSLELPKIIIATVLTGILAALARTIQFISMLLGFVKIRIKCLNLISIYILDCIPRFASITTAFERHLIRKYFNEVRMNEVKRGNFSVVINAAELRTETAFRYGSVESGCWRFGRLTEIPRVATAVAASAAFPAFLPALDNFHTFIKNGIESRHRAIITDGGVYDNLGTSCMLPGRSSEFSTNALSMDFIIACDAGQGIPAGARRPTFWMSRMLATIFAIHRRTQTLTQSLLHKMSSSGEIQGFVMPYLGQQDNALPVRPADLISREEVADYPTDFNSMSKDNIERLSKRGEQLTHCLLQKYASDL